MDEWHAKFVSLDPSELQKIIEADPESPVTREDLNLVASRAIDIIHQISELQDAIIAMNAASVELRSHLGLR